MPFDVGRFISNVNRFGTLQTNKFEVVVTNRLLASGRALFPTTTSATNAISLTDRIDTCRLPGAVLDTYETRRYGIGPVIRSVTNGRFEPLSVSVITDEDMTLHSIFVDWFSQIFDTAYNRETESGVPTFLVGYKSQYATDIQVKVFKNSGQLTATYRFVDAFPIAISDPSLSWRENNTLHKFMINFSYTSWSVTKTS